MSKNLGYRDTVDRLLVGGAFHGEGLDIAEEGKMLEKMSPGLWRSIIVPLEVTVADRKFSSVEVWTIWCCGDEFGPLDEIQNGSEMNATEEVSSAIGSPIFGDQGAVSETGYVGTEVIEDFVNDFGGYVDSVSVALAESGEG